MELFMDLFSTQSPIDEADDGGDCLYSVCVCFGVGYQMEIIVLECMLWVWRLTVLGKSLACSG
jgi:hypothetical protein